MLHDHECDAVKYGELGESDISGVLPLQEVMILFEERTMSDEKKTQRKNIKAFAVKDKLDIKLFNSNILIYQVNHPETKKHCVMCLYSTIADKELLIGMIDDSGQIDGIDIHIFGIHGIKVKSFLEA